MGAIPTASIFRAFGTVRQNSRLTVSGSSEIQLGRFRVSPYAAWAGIVTLAFLWVSVWWLLTDERLPGGGDPARHLSLTLAYSFRLESFDLGGLFELGTWGSDFFYPPLVHVVGAVPTALGLATEDWGTIAVNLVFVPLLAVGCYGVGKLVYGPRAGLLAVVFALGTPMILSLFHVYLLDAPLAAMVAMTLWALLASDRFTNTRWSIAAGALVALGLLTKTVFPIFVVGPLAVMLIAGGWRQWRNIALAAIVALVLAAPYYLMHVDDVLDVSEGTTVSLNAPGDAGPAAEFTPETRFSLGNTTYYGWAAINNQYYVPLLCLFAIGLVAAIRDIRRRGVPELLAGLVVGYLAAAYLLSVHDPRYTLPLVVYVAVLGTGWIAEASRQWVRRAATAALAVFVALNVASQSVSALPSVVVGSTDDIGDLIGRQSFTVLADHGYVVGEPRPDPLWYDLLEAAESDGVQTAKVLVPVGAMWGTDPLAFDFVANQHGIRSPTFDPDFPRQPELLVYVWNPLYELRFTPEEEFPAPCATIEEGTTDPPSDDPVILNVVALRLGPDGYERWCDF